MGSANMLASLCMMGFLLSYSHSARVSYFSFPDNADVNKADSNKAAHLVDHLLKKIEEINRLRYPQGLRLKRTPGESLDKLPWDLISEFSTPTTIRSGLLRGLIRGKKTTVNLPWQMTLNSPMLRG